MKARTLTTKMVAILLIATVNSFAATYYSQGSLAPNLLSSWNTIRAGGGSQPTTFSSALSSDKFVVQNAHSMITTATWSIGGIIGSQLQIENGGTLIASHGITIGALAGSIFQIDNGGKYIHNNTSSIATTVFAANTITVSSGSTFQINGSSSINLPSRTYSNLIINNTGSVDALGDITVSAMLTINASCIFDLQTRRLIDGGSFAASVSGILKTQSTNASPIPASITWGGEVQYNSSSGQTVVAGNYSQLTLTGGNRTLSSTGTIAIASTFTAGTGTFTTTGSTVLFSAPGGQNVPAFTSGNYNNLTIGGSGTKSLLADIIVAGTLTINPSCTFDLQTSRLIAGGSFASSGTGLLKTQSTNVSPIPASITWGGEVQYNSSSTQTVINGNYNLLTVSGGNRTLSSTGTIAISSTFTVGSGTFTSTSSTVNFNATGSQNIPAFASGSYNNITVSSTGTKTLLGDITVAGTLTLSAASDFLAINGNSLTITGTTSLTGALKGSSTSKLSIGGSAGGSPNIKLNAAANDSLLQELTLNRTGAGAGLTLASNVAITKLLTITAGAFSINGKMVTLKSSSIASTAQLATVGGSISYGTNGSFTVERFIPQGNRAYRDMAPVLSSPYTVFQNWQENGAYPSVGYGIYITGVVGLDGVDATTGFDRTQTGSKSLHMNTAGTWSDASNTYFSLNPYQGYRVLVRGDRNFLLSTIPQPITMNAATVLRINGTAITGTRNYSSTGITDGGGSPVSSYALNNTTNGFTLIANPYPAVIDWSLVSRTNISGTYTLFDPTIGTSGAYVTWNGTTNSNAGSQANNFIQLGQAIFVQTTAASPTMGITESMKATGSTLTNVFKTATTCKLSFVLMKDVTGRGFLNMDGATVVCHEGYSMAIDSLDANKFANSTENISIKKGSQLLCIEQTKPFTTNDSIMLSMSRVSNGASYKLVLNASEFSSSFQAVLVDRFLNQQRMLKLSDTTEYAFTVNSSDTNSFASRFRIIFQNSALALGNLSFAAHKKEKDVVLEWSCVNKNIKQYTLLHSINGSLFESIHLTKNNAASYSYHHSNTGKGNNYYKLKMDFNDGRTEFSQVLIVHETQLVPEIKYSIDGNKNLSLQLYGFEPGEYELDLFAIDGQKLMTRKLAYGLAANFHLNYSGWAAGTYMVLVTAKQSKKQFKKPLTLL